MSEVCDLYMRYVAVWGKGQGCVKCALSEGNLYNIREMCGTNEVV